MLNKYLIKLHNWIAPKQEISVEDHLLKLAGFNLVQFLLRVDGQDKQAANESMQLATLYATQFLTLKGYVITNTDYENISEEKRVN